MDIKNKNNLRVTFSPAHFLTCHAFTLIEILTVLVIIGIMVTGTAIAWQRVLGRVVEDVPVAAALGDMKAIKDAIVAGLYPDLGKCIPCGADPVLTTPYLCLAGCSEEEIVETEYKYLYCDRFGTCEEFECVGYEELSPECKEWIRLLTGSDHNKECGDSPKGLLKGKLISKGVIWNKYRAKGCRGPYMEPNATLDATYFDPVSYPPDAQGNDIYLDAIATPWANECEKMAIKVENQDPELAKEYRKGKYYQVLKPQQTRCIDRDRRGNCVMYGWEISDNACIVCRGADCLPGPYNDVEQYLACEFSCQRDCQRDCQPTCRRKCADPDLPPAHRPACMSTCLAGCIALCIDNCFDNCYSQCQTGQSKLVITDPDDPDYMDIGDDIVMFVFSGDIRSPLDK
jgi:prepilin-type N-terminal cleavage/methylation domain-containing protein